MIEAASERWEIEFAAEPDCRGDVVDGGIRFKLIEKPQPLLREGERKDRRLAVLLRQQQLQEFALFRREIRQISGIITHSQFSVWTTDSYFAEWRGPRCPTFD